MLSSLQDRTGQGKEEAASVGTVENCVGQEEGGRERNRRARMRAAKCYLGIDDAVRHSQMYVLKSHRNLAFLA